MDNMVWVYAVGRWSPGFYVKEGRKNKVIVKLKGRAGAWVERRVAPECVKARAS